jgi:reverse transcriptase-like protein
MVSDSLLISRSSTFQRYINWSLRDYLDEFISAYLDDILVFINGGPAADVDHRKYIQKVLERLHQTGIQLDMHKCEFEVQKTKYLGFIFEAGRGIRMDPEKVKVIMDWKRLNSVDGVRSFPGFANFYRRFIRSFSEIVAPLTALTRKATTFRWTKGAEAAFTKPKRMFTTVLILAQFDPD